jgi:PKD repeat protein
MNSIYKFLAFLMVLTILPTSTLASTGNCNTGNYTGNSTVGNCTINGFYADVTNGTAPLMVTFTGDVTGQTERITWILGTQHITTMGSRALQYRYTFETPGTYDVTFKVRGNDGVITQLTKKSYITVNKKSSSIVAVSNCKKNYNFKYTGSTTGVKEVKWNFGDGTAKCGTKVSHAYTKTGVYKVTTYVYKNDCVYKYTNSVIVK